MSLPIAAVGALIAALLETSVFPELSIGGVKPDLILVFTVVVALIVAFEDALAWAFVGGLLVDALSGRPIGATTLALLVVTGLALLAGRVIGTPRLITVAIAVFVLAWVYQVLLLAILAVTADVSFTDLPIERLLAIAIVDVVLSLLVVVAIRALSRRFGSPERIEW